MTFQEIDIILFEFKFRRYDYHHIQEYEYRITNASINLQKDKNSNDYFVDFFIMITNLVESKKLSEITLPTLISIMEKIIPIDMLTSELYIQTKTILLRDYKIKLMIDV